tara:strand:+ start:2503 stop:4251 length:1749 start_codon:yes stop_codon:yes gene_type:complete
MDAFNDAINNYKNNRGSVAQEQLEGAIAGVRGKQQMAQEILETKAGGMEASISDHIQAGMSKTMDELGLDMSIKTVGSKILPWAAKKIKGKVADMDNEFAARKAAQRQAGEQTDIDVPAGDDAARATYLDRQADLDRMNGNQARPEPPDRAGQSNDAGGPTSDAAAADTPQELDMFGNPRQRPGQDPEGAAEEPTPEVRDDDGNVLEDEDTRVANIRAQNEADDAGRGDVDYYTGTRQPLGSQEVPESGPDLTTGGANRAANAEARAQRAGEGGEGGGGAADTSAAGQAAARGAARDTSGESEEAFRGAFTSDTQAALGRVGAERAAARASNTGPAARPDGDVDNISSQGPSSTGGRFADGSEAPAPPPRTAEGGPDYRPPQEGETTGNITRAQTQGEQGGMSAESQADQEQIAREAGNRPYTDENFEPVSTEWRSQLQNQEQTESQNVSSIERTGGRDLAEEEGGITDEITQGIGRTILGGIGDGLGFAASILGPAAAIFGGIEAARGLVKSTTEAAGANDPYAKVKGLISQAQGQQNTLSAEISSDQFAEKVGAGRPSFGSLAAPTMDTSQAMQAMGSHF